METERVMEAVVVELDIVEVVVVVVGVGEGLDLSKKEMSSLAVGEEMVKTG